MKLFFREHSYNMVKMFLNQFATALFGFVLALASSKAQNALLRNLTSVFAILFYLFLLYTMTWEIGFKDRVGVETGRKPRRPLTGVWISLCANVLNYLLAVFILVGKLFPGGFTGSAGAVSGGAAVLLEGMYTGLLANKIGGVPLNSEPWVWFLTPVPAILVCGVAYLLGLHDRKFTGLFNPVLPESDREPTKGKDHCDE